MMYFPARHNPGTIPDHLIPLLLFVKEIKEIRNVQS